MAHIILIEPDPKTAEAMAHRIGILLPYSVLVHAKSTEEAGLLAHQTPGSWILDGPQAVRDLAHATLLASNEDIQQALGELKHIRARLDKHHVTLHGDGNGSRGLRFTQQHMLLRLDVHEKHVAQIKADIRKVVWIVISAVLLGLLSAAVTALTAIFRGRA